MNTAKTCEDHSATGSGGEQLRQEVVEIPVSASGDHRAAP
jgi:hypothetical protein